MFVPTLLLDGGIKPCNVSFSLWLFCCIFVAEVASVWAGILICLCIRFFLEPPGNPLLLI